MWEDKRELGSSSLFICGYRLPSGGQKQNCIFPLFPQRQHRDDLILLSISFDVHSSHPFHRHHIMFHSLPTAKHLCHFTWSVNFLYSQACFTLICFMRKVLFCVTEHHCIAIELQFESVRVYIDISWIYVLVHSPLSSYIIWSFWQYLGLITYVVM